MKDKIKKKLFKKIIFGSSAGMIITFMIVLIPCLMVLDFFGADITGSADMDGELLTDDYVINNSEYAPRYRTVLTEKLHQGLGYVPLTRIVYLSQSNKSYSELYDDNLNKETNKLKPITTVCKESKYSFLSACKDNEINKSNQSKSVQAKPFGRPIDFNKMYNVTSIFMEQRIVFGKYDVHNAWDLSAPDHTPVYSTCNGKVIWVSFTQSQNVTNTSAAGGNQIKINCPVGNQEYVVWYAHLFPGSNLVSVGDSVTMGQQIAEVGTTGYSTGSHLHYQVQYKGKDVDGMSLINFSK